MKENTEYGSLKAAQMRLYQRIREEVGSSPIFCEQRGEEVSHYTIGIARARLVQLLKTKAGYDKVEPLKMMPAVDFVDLCFVHPFQVDCYCEKYHPECAANGNVVEDRLVVDIYRQLPWNPKLRPGLQLEMEKKRKLQPLLPDYEIKQSSQPTVAIDKPRYIKSQYSTDYSVLKRGLRKKKELICSHYDIPPTRYIELLEVQLFQRPFERMYDSFARRAERGQLMLDDEQMLELLCAPTLKK